VKKEFKFYNLIFAESSVCLCLFFSNKICIHDKKSFDKKKSEKRKMKYDEKRNEMKNVP